MKRVPCSLLFRLCLAILPALMLLAGTGAQSMAQAAQGMTVVICSEGAMKTVRIGADGAADPGGAHHGPGECRDCPACVPPLAGPLPQGAGAARAADGRPVAHSRPAAAAALSRKAQAPLSRGPPSPSNRLNA